LTGGGGGGGGGGISLPPPQEVNKPAHRLINPTNTMVLISLTRFSFIILYQFL